WTAVGLAFLACGWLVAPPLRRTDCQSVLPNQDQAGPEQARQTHLALKIVNVSIVQVQAWVGGIGLAVVFLALRGIWEDPDRPYWSAAATLTVSALAGALALWSRRDSYVYASGLVANLAGVMMWVAWGPETLSSFLYTVIVGL